MTGDHEPFMLQPTDTTSCVVAGEHRCPEPCPVDTNLNGGAAGSAFLENRGLGLQEIGIARDLGTLAALVAAGELVPQISITAPWRAPWPALQALIDRALVGKAVLDFDVSVH